MFPLVVGAGAGKDRENLPFTKTEILSLSTAFIFSPPLPPFLLFAPSSFSVPLTHLFFADVIPVCGPRVIPGELFSQVSNRHGLRSDQHKSAGDTGTTKPNGLHEEHCLGDFLTFYLLDHAPADGSLECDGVRSLQPRRRREGRAALREGCEVDDGNEGMFTDTFIGWTVCPFIQQLTPIQDLEGGVLRAWALNNLSVCHTLKGHPQAASKCLVDACSGCNTEKQHCFRILFLFLEIFSHFNRGRRFFR